VLSKNTTGEESRWLHRNDLNFMAVSSSGGGGWGSSVSVIKLLSLLTGRFLKAICPLWTCQATGWEVFLVTIGPPTAALNVGIVTFPSLKSKQ